MTKVYGFNELSNCLVGKAMSKDQALSNKAKAIELDKVLHCEKDKDSARMLANMAALVLELPSGKSEEDRIKDGIMWPKGRNYRDEAKSSLIGSFKRWSKNRPAFSGKALKWDNETRAFTFKLIVAKSIEEQLEKVFPGLDTRHYEQIINTVESFRAEMLIKVEQNRAEVKLYNLNQLLSADYAMMTARGITAEQALEKVAFINNVEIVAVQSAIGQ